MFHNIFTSKNNKEKPPNKNPIIIDTREKQSLVVANLIEKKANFKFEHLEIADYLVGDVAIERKAYSDFISSIINKRLMSQLEGIKKYPRYFLIIEGKRVCDSPQDNDPSEYCRGKIHRRNREGVLDDPSEYCRGKIHRRNREGVLDDPSEYCRGKIHRRNREGVLDKAIKGMLLSIITSYQIPIIFSEDEEETAEFLITLAKQLEKPKQQMALRHTPTLLTEDQQKQFILEGFPGIGPVTADKLLNEFGSIKNIVNADEESLKKVLGKKYDKFKQLLE